ncbi:YgfZ/GcvT domain-containing protein [Schaalia cardiffensis]|uniref:CAF17-like 4Fe-4S cluster assembly/insertion protein YgfZ n=1 Tax=Schaalia cardiffensis TaxID=181487 RepID=UPI0023EFD3FF|nr:folate-binding protein [Schaalia cardiffensis]
MKVSDTVPEKSLSPDPSALNSEALTDPAAECLEATAPAPTDRVNAEPQSSNPAPAAPSDEWRSPMTRLPDAVLSCEFTDSPRPAPSSPIALHYSDPSGEQWALEEGRGLVDRADLGVIAVCGTDRHSWLTSITSQIITGMGPGDSKELLVLDPQGHIEHAAAVMDDGETTWLICEGHDTEGLAAFLDSMRFALRVEVRICGDHTLFASAGSDTDTAQGLPGLLLSWADPWPGTVKGGTEYFQGPHPGLRSRMRLHLVAREKAEEFMRAWFGADPNRRPSGMLAWEAMRIASWRPRLGWETDARSIPAELDWLRTAVHTNKGCYRGQESIARVINLGRPPRRLVFLQLDGSRGDLPDEGTRIEWRGRVVGVITSVARHAEMGPIALALLARNVPADIVFDLDGIAAAQELIVPIDGKSAISPKQRPGAELANPQLRRHDVSPIGGLGALGAR